MTYPEKIIARRNPSPCPLPIKNGARVLNGHFSERGDAKLSFRDGSSHATVGRTDLRGDLMRVVMSVLAAAAAAATIVPATASGQPKPLALSLTQMDCGDRKATAALHLSDPEAHGIVQSLEQVWKARAGRSDGPQGRHLDAYIFAFCRVSAHGQQVIVVDGVSSFQGAAICDDASNFGVVYDPRTQQFGAFVFGVSACPPERN